MQSAWSTSFAVSIMAWILAATPSEPPPTSPSVSPPTPAYRINIRFAGVGGDTDGEVGGGSDGVAANIQAMIETANDVDQADCIYIENCRCVGIVAQFGRVAGEAEDVT